MTLGIIDKLSGGRLAHGVVAATGTMDARQQVGPVGGVPQKTVAVERGGATLFMVPPLEYQDALSKATPSLRVCKVSTLGQALGDLEHFGGHVAPTLHPTPFNPRSCN
jgi:PDZ domain-containing protein